VGAVVWICEEIVVVFGELVKNPSRLFEMQPICHPCRGCIDRVPGTL
jgi:hypothetical protein